MPLTANGLSAAVKAELDAIAPSGDAETGESGDAWRQQFADAIGAAVVEYLKTNAVVNVVSVAGVMVGGGVSGPGQGTIT